ncbi:MAG: nucleotidyltransferase family protein [Planctomycetaceae bacterium]
MSSASLGPFDLTRVLRAVDKLHHRLLRATRTLDEAGIPYAVAGGNAVANWVSRVDEAAVRFTADIDVLLRRDDLEAAIPAMEQAGFRYRNAAGVHMFLDGPDGKFRDAVHVLFADEKVRPEYAAPAPRIEESEPGQEYSVLSLDALVRMLLTSFKTMDCVHLRDMLDVGLIDAGWLSRLPPQLASRLQQLLDDPEG